jgi:hypothetical protein
MRMNVGGVDTYSLMFSLELASFVFVLFFYTQMSTLNTSVNSGSAFLSYIPGDMVLTLLAQMMFIVIDRILYRLQLLSLKFVFHVFNLFFWTYFIFFSWPSFNKNRVGQRCRISLSIFLEYAHIIDDLLPRFILQLGAQLFFLTQAAIFLGFFDSNFKRLYACRSII